MLDVLILTADNLQAYRRLEQPGVRIILRRPDEAIPEIGQVQAVVGGWFSPELLQAAPRLQYFFVPFAGISQELRALLSTRPDLVVANSHYNADFVAEHVFALLFRLCRHLEPQDRYMRRPALLRRFFRPKADFLALKGKTLGILGHGHIGRAVACRAEAFGMSCWIYGRQDFARDATQGRSRLHELLRGCRFVVLALPLTGETRGLLGREELRQMRADAFLINISRGEVVEEGALFEALKARRIRGAGIDAWYNYQEGFFNPERPFNRRFHRLRNLVMTPHVAYRGDSLEEEKINTIGEFIRQIRDGGDFADRVDLNRGY